MGWTQYKSTAMLLDVTCTALGATQTIQSPQSGSLTQGTGVIQVSSNSLASTALTNGYLADGYVLEIVSPVDADGTYPDVDITFLVDGKNLQDYIMIDGSMDGNMFPRAISTVGKKSVKLGESTRWALAKIAQSQGRSNPIPRLPLRITGLKASSSISIIVSSTAGWGQNGTVQVPLRVMLKGDLFQASDLTALAPFWSGVDAGGVAYSSILLGVDPFNPVSIPSLDIGGPLSAATWTSLPGGVRQGATKVWRRLTYAKNGNATGTSGIYTFTQQQSMQGQQTNVVDQQHDLGDDFSLNNNVMVWEELGYRLSQNVAAYIGFRINGDIVPQDTPQGTPISQNVNDFQYGTVQPQRPESGLYFPLPDARNLARVIGIKNSVVPFISTAGTTSIAAGNVKVAKGGVLIEQP